MNTITMALQNSMIEDIASPRPTKETFSFSLCNAPIRRKPSFEYNVHQVQELSNNLLLPMLDSDDEQDGPQPMLRPRREPLPFDFFSFCNDVDTPESPMRIPTEDEDYATCSDVSADDSSYCPMPMALDDDSLSLSDNESLEGLPFAPSFARGFEESLSNDNVVCQLALRFNRPTPAIVLQPRSRTTNAQFVFRGQDLEFPSL